MGEGLKKIDSGEYPKKPNSWIPSVNLTLGYTAQVLNLLNKGRV